MKALSPGMSRFAALCIAALALVLLATYVVSPLIGYYTEKADEVRHNRSKLERFKVLLARGDSIEERLQTIASDGSDSDLFLNGSRPSIASANLREFLSDTVEASGGSLVSSQEYDAQGIEGATTIGLQFDVIGNISNLVRLLHGIENARPIIFIDKLMVTSSSSRVAPAGKVRNGQRVRSSDEQPQLRIRMSVIGYLLGSEVTEDDSEE